MLGHTHLYIRKFLFRNAKRVDRESLSVNPFQLLEIAHMAHPLDEPSAHTFSPSLSWRTV